RFVDFADGTRCDLWAREQQRRLKTDLEAALGPGHVRRFPATWTGTAVSRDHLEGLCDAVFNDLRSVIEAEIAKLTAGDAIRAEVEAHLQFGTLRGGRDRFQGREELLDHVADYIAAREPDRALVIHGPAGSGKSAVLARAAAAARDRLPDAVILERYVG